MKTIQELVPLIQEWAKERGIFDKSTPFDQLLKTHEEVGELIKACYDNDKPAIQDAIGDVLVTLINYCYKKRIDVLEQINEVLNFERKITDSKVVLALSIQNSLTRLMNANFRLLRIGGETPFLYFYEIITMIGYLDDIAFLENSTLEECLNIAYNEIKNRTGKMINGKFVQDEKYTFCKIFDLEDKQILIRKDYCEEDRYKIKVSTFNGEILSSFSFGYIKEEEADECFDSITVEEILRYLKNIDTKETKDEK